MTSSTEEDSVEPFEAERTFWSDPKLQQRLMAVATEAMRASGCSNSVICRATGEFTAVLASGERRLEDVRLQLADGEEATGSRDPLVQLIGLPDLGLVKPRGAQADAVRFVAVLPIGADTGLLLALFDAERRLHLDRDTQQVLQTHASHLCTLIEMGRMEAKARWLDVGQQGAQLAKFGLLESVAVFARDAILITEAEPIDAPGPRIIYCNAAFTETTGYSDLDILGQSPRILQGDGTSRASLDTLRRALESWSPVEVELLNYRKDGSAFWVEISIFPVSNKRGWFTHWVSVQRDITERKNAEFLQARMRSAEAANRKLTMEVAERKRVEAELLHTSSHDSLTQLRTRGHFMSELHRAMDHRAHMADHGCTVLFIDLDRFKTVNDTLGHAEGDVMLLAVSERLRRSVRSQDVLARLGGDEFAVLIEGDPGIEAAVSIAERIVLAMREPLELAGTPVVPSCSIGIAHSAGSDQTADELMRDADIAMYEAKRAALGTFTIFDPSMHDSTVARLTLHSDLRSAIQNEELRVIYQPIIDPTTSRIVSFEALVRWNHPTRGMVSPSVLVSAAEEMGIIREIDRYMLTQACRQLAEWHRLMGSASLGMSVNVSAAAFSDPSLLGEIARTLAEFALRPEALELEITERIFLDPAVRTLETIEAVRGLGVRVALDDFGTGYSSLSYVSRYPIDTIKIDKSFIDTLRTDNSTHAVVELIVQLGRRLDLRIVAEGVETLEQVDELLAIGCRAIQGYYYSEPLPPSLATQLLFSNAG